MSAQIPRKHLSYRLWTWRGPGEAQGVRWHRPRALNLPCLGLRGLTQAPRDRSHARPAPDSRPRHASRAVDGAQHPQPDVARLCAARGDGETMPETASPPIAPPPLRSATSSSSRCCCSWPGACRCLRDSRSSTCPRLLGGIPSQLRCQAKRKWGCWCPGLLSSSPDLARCGWMPCAMRGRSAGSGAWCCSFLCSSMRCGRFGALFAR